MTTFSEVLAAIFAGLVIGLAGALALAGILLIDGTVTSVVWNWLAVPILHVPTLSPVGGIGLAIVWSCFKGSSKKDDRKTAEVFGSLFARWAVLVSFAYFVHLFL